MSAFLRWLGNWVLGALVDKILAALGSLVAAGRRDQANRDAGAAEAVIEGRKQEDDALAKTQAAIDRADKKPIEYRD